MLPNRFASTLSCCLVGASLPAKDIVTKGIELDQAVSAELKELREVKRRYERLQLEHDLLKKAIAFTSKQKAMSSPSSPIIKKPAR